MRIIQVLALAVLTLGLCSCGGLDSGNILVPGNEIEEGFTFSAKAENATDGDSLFIQGTFSGSPGDPYGEQRSPFGIIVDDQVIANYSRPVFGAGESYTAWFTHRRMDGRYYPLEKDLRANGTLITALAANPYAFAWKFAVTRPDSASVGIVPIRDDRNKLVSFLLWSDGIYSTHPDSLGLNTPVSADRPLYYLSAWTRMQALPCEWLAGNRWGMFTTLAKPGEEMAGLYYLRVEDVNGSTMFAGVHITYGNAQTTITLNHLVNGGAANDPWLVFAVRVLEDGSIVNAGPNNLVYMVTIGKKEVGA